MTDNTQPEAGSTHIIRYALEMGLLWIGRDKVREALDALDTLEAQLEAIGAGGVNGPLMGRASLAANAGSEPVAPPPLQHFESPRAKILMRAWQEGWGACRDAEYVGEDAQNDAFNQSSTVNHCVDEDMLYTHPSPPERMVGGWMPIETAPKDGTYLLLWEQYSTNPFVGCWAFGAWTVSHEHVDAEGGWDGANVVDSISQELITHWMKLPESPYGKN